MLVVSIGHAGELLAEDFIGIRWGSQVTEPSNLTEQPHWLTERKGDGTFRSRGVTVDHGKKIYFLGETGVGTWEFKNGALSHLVSNGLEWKAEGVHQDGKVLRWEKEKKSGLSDSILEKNSEEPVGTFSVPLGKDYREVTEAEFESRNREANHREPAPFDTGSRTAESGKTVTEQIPAAR